VARKKEADRVERLQIMLAPDELAALDNWRFEKRMPSRAAAIRELLRRGLADRDKASAEPGAKSSSYGVMKNKSRE
jgi:metal-responsive CopG/Arc/MetJ family transcriptional regulator